MPLVEVARTAHQGPGGAGPDEEHVQSRELTSDGRRGAAIVRPPVVRVRVLVEPYVTIVGRTQRADVLQPSAEETRDGVRLGDDAYFASQRLHEQSGRQVATGVGHA